MRTEAPARPRSGMTPSTVLDRPARAQLPAWAKPLTRPARYKVLYGGRGSGKTWTTATLLVLRAAERPLRVACVREYQKSIHESAKRTIEDSIGRLGLGAHFEIQRDYIRGRNGSLFFFRGMSTSTEEAIRGWEAVDAVWVEEAQRMSQRSREILYPRTGQARAHRRVRYLRERASAHAWRLPQPALGRRRDTRTRAMRGSFNRRIYRAASSWKRSTSSRGRAGNSSTFRSTT